jgi:hypothetical protein
MRHPEPWDAVPRCRTLPALLGGAAEAQMSLARRGGPSDHLFLSLLASHQTAWCAMGRWGKTGGSWAEGCNGQ